MSRPHSSRKPPLQTMEIDHRQVEFPAGATVLRAAELNGISIPSLCSHKELSPFGGCRMCVVEIEGMRGYPLACSTVAQPGMKAQTDTATLREMRKEILQLILSEHPSSCLICSEQAECRQNQNTIRKVGVSTGCRFCPNDGQCELAALVEKLGVTDISYPIYYRGYEAEHDDPFFDRDYNLCILCGRCVRMCQELRGTGVLAFKYRGPKTQVGPAFAAGHVEAGCEFCGACVSVCPTGALADKVSKWDGKPDGSVVSTCPFCAIGCQVELHHKGGRLSKVYPHLDPEINDGQLCVRGRFCMPEATHHHERAKKPELRRGKYFREVGWDEALDEVASRLKSVAPEDVLMVVSPDLTNESLWAAQKLVRSCLGSGGIDTTARRSLPGGPGLWAQLFSFPLSITALAEAETIVAVGVDTRFSFSVTGVEIRRALRHGATLVTVDAMDSNLARYTDHWLRPRAGTEGAVLAALTAALDRTGVDLTDVAARTAVDLVELDAALLALRSSGNLAVLVGPRVLANEAGDELAQSLLALCRRPHTTLVPLYYGANCRGALELGAFRELGPGLVPVNGTAPGLEDLLAGRARPKLLYLVGETPFLERPDCDYVVAQDLYHPPFDVDAFLPAASFAEAEGSITNLEGRVQGLHAVEELPASAVAGFARPDWQIFGELAARLGDTSLAFKSAQAVRRDIHAALPDFPLKPDRKRRTLEAADSLPVQGVVAAAAGSGDLLLIVEPAGFAHRGTDLAAVVEGLGELALEECLRLHPQELSARGVEPGGWVTVAVDGVEVTARVRADADCPHGVVLLHRPHTFGGLVRRRPLLPLYRAVTGPARVTVRPADKPASG